MLHSLIRCRSEELVEWADRAIALAGDDSPAGIEAAAIRGLGLSGCGRFAEATAAYDDLTNRVRHGAQAQRVTMGQGWLQLSIDDIDGARISLESAIAMAQLGGSARITLWALGWLARVQFLTGEWDRALHTVEQGRALAASSGIVLTTPLLEWTAAEVHALRGNWPDAATAARSADAVTQDYDMMRIPTLLARAQIAEAEADYGKVRPALEPLTRMTSGTAVNESGAVAVGGRDGQRVGPRRAARLRRRVSAATRGTGSGTGTAVCDGAAWLRAGPAVGCDRRLGSGPKVFR